MNDVETQERFIGLRAEGWSFARIADELRVYIIHRGLKGRNVWADRQKNGFIAALRRPRARTFFAP